MNLRDIPKNKENINKLLEQKEFLVPFIGAGFSRDACPTWAEFLDKFFQQIKKDEFLHPEDEVEYADLINSNQNNKFEKIADFLIKKSGRGRFEEELKIHFDKSILPTMRTKFYLLHKAFPGLKITTNFDCIIENSGSPTHMDTCHGTHPEDLQRLFSRLKENSLLKIHGCLRDINSIILSAQKYEEIYGDKNSFSLDAPLPKFLDRVFSNNSVLFIGCSLSADRILMILEKLPYMHPHFALMQRPKLDKERVNLNRHFSTHRITPIWYEDFQQIEEILELLAVQSNVLVDILPEHGTTFVAREKHLSMIGQHLENLQASEYAGGVCFILEGAGGMGKTIFAYEVTKRFSKFFPDGVIPIVSMDKITVIQFAHSLVQHFKIVAKDPTNESEAQALLATILKERQALLILDNVNDWELLKWIIPPKTRSIILATTRNREIFHKVRGHFSWLKIIRISLERFNREESLALFNAMLCGEYKKQEEKIYLEIADILGYLPLALRQAISLMLYGPYYTAEVLLDKLKKGDPLDLLSKGRIVEGGDSKPIETVFDLSSALLTEELIVALEYLSTCGPGPVPLDFLQKLANDPEILEKLERLHKISWCERTELKKKCAFELQKPVRELVKRRFKECYTSEFIQCVHGVFMDKTLHYSAKELFFPQLEEAFKLLSKAQNKQILLNWVYDLYFFCISQGHSDFYMSLIETTEGLYQNNPGVLNTLYGRKALLYRSLGKVKEAVLFHQKEEALNLQLDNRVGLARTYGNQAGIVQQEGRLVEAFDLYNKALAIFEETGEYSGMARCLCNEALILMATGNLEEAMVLSQKAESIFAELEDRQGLAGCYCNQAKILLKGEKWDEALGRYTMQEKICTELGDNAGLARSYDGQALVKMAKNDLDKALSLLKREEKICKKIKEPTGLARCVSNQAQVFCKLNRIDEALTLFNKTQELYEKLNDKVGLAGLLWNKGIISMVQKRPADQIEFWQKAVQLLKSIGVACQKYDEELVLIIKSEQ